MLSVVPALISVRIAPTLVQLADRLTSGDSQIFLWQDTTHLAASTAAESKVPAVAEKVKAVETVDHPSDGQLLAYARQYFVSAGGMQ
jgi:hypothetical protein